MPTLLSLRFKYLGCLLKPNNYHIINWDRLVHKIQKKLALWDDIWLSLSGRVIMIKVVLQGISVYWLHLFLLPVVITHKINAIFANFLCFGPGQAKTFHLIKLGSLSHPLDLGGLGIMDTKQFNMALLSHNLWWVFNVPNLWSEILKGKYLYNHNLEE